jgi:hypothetical protein
MDKISVTVINRILENEVNSKSTAIYFFLAALSEEEKGNTGNAVIYDVNPYKIYKLMEENNIRTSHRQICFSLIELEAKGLISYPSINCDPNNQDKSTIILLDACIDFQKGDELLQSKGYVDIPQILLTNMFYRMSARAKRLFLYIYKHFLRSKEFFLNILKPETYKILCELLKVNRPQKIRDTLEEIKALLKVTCIKCAMKIETYKFEIASIIKNTLIKNISSFSVVKPAKRLLQVWKIMLWMQDHGYDWSTEEIDEIVKATALWKWRDVITVLDKYIKAKIKKSIQHIAGYLKAAREKTI